MESALNQFYLVFIFTYTESEAYQGLPQTSTIKSFGTIGNGFQPLTIVAKRPILDACGRSGHAWRLGMYYNILTKNKFVFLRTTVQTSLQL